MKVVPSQELALRQVELLETVKRAWFQPRDSALSLLYDAYDALLSIDEALFGAAGANAMHLIGYYVQVFGGRTSVAQAALDRAERWARSHDDAVLLCFVLAKRGASYDGELALGKSFAAFSQALQVARTLHIRDPEVSALMLLALRAADGGLHEVMARCYERCTELIGDKHGQPWDEYRLVIETNLGWASVLAGHFEDALLHADRWLALIGADETKVPDPRHIGSTYDNRAQALLGLGRVQEAVASAQLARTWAERSQYAYGECAADLVLGRAEVAAGQQREGLALIQRAVERSRVEVPRLLPAALVTAARVYEDLQQADSADMVLHELYLLRCKMNEHVLSTLESDAARLLASNPALRRAEFGVIRLGAADSLHLDEASRESLSSINLLLEEHAVAAERLDDTTGAHCYRVGRMAALLGQEIGLGEDTCFLMELSARLHDVGKLMVPDELLMKPGRLTHGERQVMQRHTVAGWEILAKTQVPQMHVAQEIARHHHEWWDGSGYPDGMAGPAIPLTARVSALADVFDALTHARPYKPAWPIGEALEEIVSLKGIQFDPELTDVFIAMVKRLLVEHENLDDMLAEAASRSMFFEAREQMAQLLKGTDAANSTYDPETLKTQVDAARQPARSGSLEER